MSFSKVLREALEEDDGVEIVLSSVDSGAFVNAETIGVLGGFAARSDTSAL